MLGFTFSQPGRLWLLAGVAGLLAAYIVLQALKRHYAVRFTNLDLLDKVAPKRPGWRRHLVAMLFLGGIALQVVAFAGPQRVEKVPRERATVIVAVDVSLSMEATDVSPSRIEGAKQAAKQFVQQMPDKFNVALVAFSGVATLKVPPTQDHTLVENAIDKLQLAEGTAIGDAILVSLDAIKSIPADDQGTPAPTVIVLMSDGKTTKGTPNDVAVQQAHAAGIPISTIAFGTSSGIITLPEQPAPIPVPVDVAALADIANATGGKTYDTGSTQELKNAYSDIGSSVAHVNQPHSIAGWFVGLALLAAMLTALGSLAWFSRLP